MELLVGVLGKDLWMFLSVIKKMYVCSCKLSGEGCSILVSKKWKHRFSHLCVVDIKGRSDYFSVVHSLSGLFAFSALTGLQQKCIQNCLGS